ncbi:MAG: peptide-methionine (R)-S-oxide reductase [Betaproteobacteria bacterium]|nr:peptide-methionine (R)-S-oxide reductase [Betaproteobacteria bacterium]
MPVQAKQGDKAARGESITRSDAEWRAMLTPLQYIVTRKHATERAFSGEQRSEAVHGVYRCVCCDAVLFRSADELDSEGGWPGFSAPAAPDIIRTAEDCSWLARRIEAVCARCDAHLGHLSPDDPAAQGRSYSINSAALRFTPSRPV